MCGTTDMREYQRRYWAERQTFLIERGFCVKCGHEKAAPNHKLCLDCLAKARIRNAKNAEKRRAYDREHAQQTHQRAKERYEARKAESICTKCGKKPAWGGGLKCYECTLRDRRWVRERKQRKRALEPVKPKKKAIPPPPRKQGANHPWRRENRAVFIRWEKK